MVTGALIFIAVVLLIVSAVAFINQQQIGGAVCVVLGLCVGAGGLWVGPKFNVYIQEMEGQAELARAKQNRQIKVSEAEAAKESAALLADAEVARAKGVAEANKIVANGLGGPEGYLRYLYIEGLKDALRNGSQVIYVPTEAGLPILEATRLN
ncbi:MAG: hypothetical protein Unbinned664contig1000_6 [Prokaryotic dsDNA virus sp.]|nr:MAG: hypothetical protein Unbinned664contig1000_6 [Prokaryotic dsDNA virus sp.]|tara:strand:- start:25553 stop:26011 length:459 start_codon:yes stop_codon:yes gene_type:complete